MPRRAVNLALLIAVPLLVATGLLAWVAPHPYAPPLLVAHRIGGVALILGLAWKYGIARRSLRRRVWRRDLSVISGTVGSIALLVVLGLGLAWTIGLVSFDRPLAYSMLNVHVLVGVALAPLVVAHAAQRWERRPALVDLADRRTALRAVGLGAVAVVVTAALDTIDRGRRFTGSRPAASHSGNDFPLTIWRFDDVPALDPATWRLALSGLLSSPGELTYAELAAMATTERDALIDCTGGWWSEQRWRGVTLADLLAARGVSPTARRLDVVSVTGHSASFAISESPDLLFATHVGGEVLSPGHGYPLRLVAADHRGFTWIKWVARVDVT
jgi:DMSO/TMAO reductase YedYZ molybdopterin-dependent catalytic subunit